MAGKKYTIRRVHVGGLARVHDPGVGVLERHLVQGGNEAGLIPHLRGGDLSRSERGVRLGVGAKEAGRAPALHALPPAVAAGPPALAALPGAAGLLTRGTLGGVRVEADPGSHRTVLSPLWGALQDACLRAAGALASLATRSATLAAAFAALLLGRAAASAVPALAATAQSDARKGAVAAGAGTAGGGGGDEGSGRRILRVVGEAQLF